MSNDKQTAVDWVFNEIILAYLAKGNLSFIDVGNIKEQAKEMEKSKAFEIFKAGQDSMEEGGKGFEQWYEQTYGGNK